MDYSHPGFCIVLRDSDDRLVRHTTEEKALTEAKRLAAANPGQAFYVLAAMRVAQTKDPVEVRETRMAIPF